jgi:hypothetical protein
MDVSSVFKVVKPIFEKHRNEANVEFEIRLGKFNCGTFDTDIGKGAYEYALAGLKKYTGWEKIVVTNEEVFYRESDNLRISIDEDAGTENIVKKTNVHKEDFNKLKNTPYDIRFSVSTETPLEDYEGEMDKKKTKHRVSFVRKNLSIDVTAVTGDAEDIDSEESTVYQLEFEIVDPSLVKTDDELFNIIHKVKDVFIMFANNNE